MIVQYLTQKYTNLKYRIAIRKKEKRFQRYTRHVEIDVSELFFSQRKQEMFNRYDIVVRYLAIEECFGKNDYGFHLYKKMQQLRNPQDDLDEYEYKFRELIKSFDKSGYQKESEIVLDEDMQIEDGAHRVSLALYFGIERLNAKVLPQKGGAFYSLDWFLLNGFTDKECDILKKKLNELEEKYNKTIAVILWPNVSCYFDEITERINKVWKVEEVKDITFRQETFSRAVKGIYYVDDISLERICNKIEHLGNDDNLIVRIMKTKVLGPCFRLKQDNGNTLLIQGEKLKKMVRNQYKHKINNYYYDNIIHTADNFYQSKHIIDLFYHNIDIRGYLKELSGLNYMLIKLYTNYLPSNFPDEFAFSKDLDILCDSKDFEEVKRYTRSFFDNYVRIYEAKEIEKANNWRYRLEKNGYLVIQVDVSTYIEGLKESFLCSALMRKENRTDGLFYVPRKEDEICFRLNEYKKAPQKEWHADYIRDNKESISEEVIRSAFIEKDYEEYIKMMETIVSKKESGGESKVL